jgi:hypothetical protein
MNDIAHCGYPKVLIDDDSKYTMKNIPAFANMQIRNGPFGAISTKGLSTGSVHFICDKSIDDKIFLDIVNWIEERALLILDKALSSFMDDYNEMRPMVIECLIDEDPDDVVPKINSYKELLSLCGIVGVYIRSDGATTVPEFGIEFGCNWEDSHGAGAAFKGVELIESGGADILF